MEKTGAGMMADRTTLNSFEALLRSAQDSPTGFYTAVRDVTDTAYMMCKVWFEPIRCRSRPPMSLRQPEW
jgi:hypothetical protein